MAQKIKLNTKLIEYKKMEVFNLDLKIYYVCLRIVLSFIDKFCNFAFEKILFRNGPIFIIDLIMSFEGS